MSISYIKIKESFEYHELSDLKRYIEYVLYDVCRLVRKRDNRSNIHDRHELDHVIGLCNDGTIGYFKRSQEELGEHEFEISEAAAVFLFEELGFIKLLYEISLYYQHACPDEFKILAL